MMVDLASSPLAAPKSSSQGRELVRRLQSHVQLAEHPESTVARSSGSDGMDADRLDDALGAALLVPHSVTRAELYEWTSPPPLSISLGSHAPL